MLAQMALKHPQYHEGSKYVLVFAIEQWEGSFYSESTNTHRMANYNICSDKTALVTI